MSSMKATRIKPFRRFNLAFGVQTQLIRRRPLNFDLQDLRHHFDEFFTFRIEDLKPLKRSDRARFVGLSSIKH